MYELAKEYKDQRKMEVSTLLFFWCGLIIVTSLYSTIPLTSVLSKDFSISGEKAGLSSSSFSFFYAIGFLIFGRLSERIGRKKVILIGLFGLSIFTTSVGLCNNFTLLLIFRGLQGLAAASFAPSALAYVVEMLPAGKRITSIGLISSSFLLAGIFGQILSSLMNTYYGWQSLFYLLGMLYFFTLIAVLFRIKNDPVSAKKNDHQSLFEQVKLLAQTKSLLYCYFITITLLLAFVGMYSTLGIYLDEKFALLGNEILYVRAIGIIGMLFAPFTGHFVKKYGVEKIVRIGLFLAVTGLTLLGVMMNLWFSIISSIIFVSGISLTIPSLITLIGQLAGKQHGMAVALYTFILFIGATLGSIVASKLLRIGNFFIVFEVFALLLILSFLGSFFIKRA